MDENRQSRGSIADCHGAELLGAGGHTFDPAMASSAVIGLNCFGAAAAAHRPNKAWDQDCRQPVAEDDVSFQEHT